MAGTIGLVSGGSGVKMWSNLSMEFNPFDLDDSPASPSQPISSPDPAPAREVIVPIASVNASAYSSEEAHPRNSVDNDLQSRWAVNGIGEMLDLNFAGSYRVTRVEVKSWRSNERQQYFNLRLYQNRQFRTVASIEAGDRAPRTNSIGAGVINISNGNPSTGIRFQGFGNSSNDWSTVEDIVVYGYRTGSQVAVLPTPGGSQATNVGDSSSGGGRSPASNPSPSPNPEPNPGAVTACNDGVDNDGDGLTDWQNDLGCSGPSDSTEGARPRSQENGWSTFDMASDTRIIYVAANGNDSRDGRTPQRAVRTIQRGASLVRDGRPDWLLIRRGDSFRVSGGLGRFKSGRSADQRMIVATSGDSTRRPVIRHDGTAFISTNNQGRSHLAIKGIELIRSDNDPAERNYNPNATNDELSISFYSPSGGRNRNILIEDVKTSYGKMRLRHIDNGEVRRSTIFKAYHATTCAYNSNGTRDRNGSHDHRPQGIYAANNNRLTIEENIFDHNGWNEEDVPSACATIFNHNIYISHTRNTIIRNNILARASSQGIKVRADSQGNIRDLVISGNVFAEGEIGISLGGNPRSNGTYAPYRFINTNVSGNVFTDIGRSNPTRRGVSWYLTYRDNDGALCEDNYFLNQPSSGNRTAVRLQSSTNRNVRIRNNTFSRMSNTVQGAGGSGFINVSVSGTRVRNNVAVRNIDTYARSINAGSNLAQFMSRARSRSRLNYNPNFTTERVRNYLTQPFQ